MIYRSEDMKKLYEELRSEPFFVLCLGILIGAFGTLAFAYLWTGYL